jgi:tryptophan synthase beta chain
MNAKSIENSNSPIQDLIHGRLPDESGRFGPFGGRFVSETLMHAITVLEHRARTALNDTAFVRELESELADWVGRPTPITEARSLGRLWRATILLKREDLAHTGAHKINNAIGQALLARWSGAKEVIAETGAGQHGVATASACARLGLPCTIYMGAVDIKRQAPNVDRMIRLGATVVEVTSQDATLRSAVNEAMRRWIKNPDTIYYLLGSAIGPHPYPWLVRELQKVIGIEARRQVLKKIDHLPDAVVASVGGGSNAIGLFHGFLADPSVRLVGAEAGGTGVNHNAASIVHGTPGVLHGCHTMVLQDADGQVRETGSVSAGLDYPAVGPEHAYLNSVGRAEYRTATDIEALAAFDECCASEGIIPALESAHALAVAKQIATESPQETILVGLSGRGDKDLPTLREKQDANHA